TALCADLAQQVIADGEGVTRVFEIHLRGALTDAEAKLAARTITTSNLVKTAVHGADPNWGRILAAAGRSGARVDQARASVRIGDQVVYDTGSPRAFDADAVRRIFGGKRIGIEVDLGLGPGFVRGLRVTDAATRDVALAVLVGLANTRTVSALLARGVPAVGLSGVDAAMLRAERESDELGLVGRITRVDSAVLEELVDAGRVPVVAPAAIEAPGDGEPLDEVFNVNADSVAGAIAASLSARLPVFVTDVPGVRAKDGKVIGSLDLGRAKALIDDGTIEGGMLPKVEACLVAARAGCRAAIV